MKKLFTLSAAALALGAATLPAASVAAQGQISPVIITDVGGVDDKSFNQSAWEGLQAYGEENELEEGPGGFFYLESKSDSDYVTNINTAIQGGSNLIFGIGYKLQPAIDEAAGQNPDANFVIVDSVVEQDNVASITFKDNEAAFLAGVAAAMTTKTDHIGFIGGVESEVIDRFEAGFVAGAKTVNPDIEISIEYAGHFADAPKGKQLAASIYSSGADIIYHAAGGTGQGVFSEAKDRVSNDPSQELYVIGVDLDQDAEGLIEIDGEERHLTLTSTLKQVGESVKAFTEKTQADGFEGGVQTLGLADGGVDLTTEFLTDEVKKAVEDYKQQIIDGDIVVPEKPGEEMTSNEDADAEKAEDETEEETAEEAEETEETEAE
ncbi:BMP family protein [Facklamia sp. 7083-14-GEN3]|uniref:BMP family lipoprotein n=1 Tax=Facklamia sp. 7083-14-GEN3 TaxID=2973478 RepID=UPI00215B926F|nr:BMP family protein [Facklamia sp. 7083-14-GEN3]MCR8969190.1 BMP family protein [Facklamia sp. 7083-14-GEN3]